MPTKLTLRLDEHLIEQAKKYARDHRTSLSQLVAGYFALLKDKGEATRELDKIPPLTRSLWGALEGVDFDREDHLDYLEEKHR